MRTTTRTASFEEEPPPPPAALPPPAAACADISALAVGAEGAGEELLLRASVRRFAPG
jgi:hypothetical protein